jgi:hypothetical protein
MSKKATVYTVIAVLILSVIVINRIRFLQKEEEQKQILIQVNDQLKQDTELWLNSLNPDTTIAQKDVGYMIAHYHRLDPADQKKMDNINIITGQGTVTYDEFTRTDIISSSVKNVKVKFGDRNKYTIESQYKGFKSAISKRALALQQKYPDWSKDVCIAVADRKIHIGMNQDMCREAWGKPGKINRTTTAYGTSEQWVYGYNYVYFDGDVLTTIQN